MSTQHPKKTKNLDVICNTSDILLLVQKKLIQEPCTPKF